jgi:hypothetical protein
LSAAAASMWRIPGLAINRGARSPVRAAARPRLDVLLAS